MDLTTTLYGLLFAVTLTVLYAAGIKLATPDHEINPKTWNFWTGLTIAYLPAFSIITYTILNTQ